MSEKNNVKIKKKESRFKIPNSIVVLFIIIAVITLLTYIIPPGNFAKVVDPATGVEMVDASSFTYAEERTPVSVFGMFVSIQQGFIDSSNVIFLIIFAYFCVFTIIKTGSIHAGVNSLLRALEGKNEWIIPIFFVVFALAGSTYGEWDTIYGLIPIFVGLAVAMGYDALVGLAMSGMAVAVGFASATTNPFTIGVAQSYADLPIFSGMGLRIVVFVVFVGVGIFWTMRYAKKVKADPSKSLVAGIDLGSLDFSDKNAALEFTVKRKMTLIILLITIAAIVFGSLKFGWYLNEMSAIFIISAIIVSIIWKMNTDEIVDNLLKSAGEIIVGAFVVGFSRTILVVLNEANIIDTIVYGLYQPLQNLPKILVAEGLLIFHNFMNLLIPSGSGQAAALMPIVLPLADLAGINRQVAILAYQFGDGYSNLIWPTCGIAAMASLAKVPLDKWYKFFLPLFGIMMVLQIAFIAVAVAINYGPF